MSAADRERWDVKYAERDVPATVEPPEWLVRHAAELPPGRALDIACGIGHAAIWLAQRGWDVTALDISPIGLAVARRFAEQCNVSVNFLPVDLDITDLGTERYDLITVFRFLDRSTLPQRITRALRPDGLLLYETFLGDNGCPGQRRPANPEFLLATGELPRLFPRLKTLEYVETTVSNGLASYAGVFS